MYKKIEFVETIPSGDWRHHVSNEDDKQKAFEEFKKSSNYNKNKRYIITTFESFDVYIIL